MPGSHEDGVDGVAFGSGERVAFEKTVAFRVTDDRFDGAASSQLALDRWRSIAGALRDMDVGGCEPMAAVTLIDIGAGDRHAG